MHPNRETQEEHDDHGGMDRDMPHLLGRREALRWMGGLSLAGLLAACGIRGGDSTSSTLSTVTTVSDASSPTSTTAGPSQTTTGESSAGAEIPDETAGPFPADGSNGPNVLGIEGVVRSDLTTSFGDLTGTAAGVPLAIQLAIVEAGTGEPMPEAVVYLWHCDAEGRYSIYEVTDQNYLRGAQVADGAGRVTFDSIFPGCYAGRWPHCHFEVYESLDQASAGSQALKTSQLALPQADCEVVYADSRYGASAQNLSQLSLASDNVFSDGWADQLAVMSGSTEDGFKATLLVRV